MIICDESPKYYITQNQFDKAFKTIEELTGEPLSEQNKSTLIMQSLVPDDQETNSAYSNYSDLFSGENKRMILSLFVLWFIVAYVYFGLIYILPTIYEDFNKNSGKHSSSSDDHVSIKSSKGIPESEYSIIISYIIVSCAFEIPSDISNGILPNLKILGRKGTIILGFFACVIFSTMSLVHPIFMPLYSSFIKFFINTAFGTLFIYTSEAFPTYLRTTSIGLCNVFSRLGGFSAPFIFDALFKIANFFPFIGVLTAAFIGLATAISLPFDTLGKVLK